MIRGNDIIEDVASGKRERVSDGFYSCLRGYKASEARELPAVYDVVRHLFE